MRPAPIDFVVEVVNAWSPTVRTVADDYSPYPDLDDVCAAHDVEPHRTISDDTIAELAEATHRMFSTNRRPIGKLGDLVARLDAKAAIDADGAGWRVPPAQWLHGAVLGGLVEHARTDPLLDRLGTCTAHRCVDAYLDATQAATKKYCSGTCQTRAKAAARRSRLATPT